MTSMGTPARPCRSILRSARDEMWTVSELSIRFVLSCRSTHVSGWGSEARRGRGGAYCPRSSTAQVHAAAEQAPEPLHDDY
jgi:hypothetical protein